MLRQDQAADPVEAYPQNTNMKFLAKDWPTKKAINKPAVIKLTYGVFPCQESRFDLTDVNLGPGADSSGFDIASHPTIKNVDAPCA
jgi:hypothetical protein